MKIREMLVLTAFSLCIVSPVVCQTAEEIVDRYVEAIGGRDAIDAIQTMKIVRDFEHIEDGRIERGVNSPNNSPTLNPAT